MLILKLASFSSVTTYVPVDWNEAVPLALSIVNSKLSYSGLSFI